jgi:hypothetical protein
MARLNKWELWVRWIPATTQWIEVGGDPDPLRKRCATNERVDLAEMRLAKPKPTPHKKARKS